MKKIVLLLIIGFFAFHPVTGFASDSTYKAVHWEYSGTRKNGQDYALVFKASIDSGWKLFSTTMPDDQPNTRLVLDSGVDAKIDAITEKGNLQSKKEPLFNNAEIRYFEKNAELLITVTSTGKSNLKGNVNFMAIRGDEVIGPEAVPFRFSFDANGGIVVQSGNLQQSTAAAQNLKKATIDLHHPVVKCGGTGAEDAQSRGLVNIFILGFIWGLIALLTPCVFPMMPLTVSFFTKKSQDKKKGIVNAITYGFFIFLIYVLLSVPFYFLDSIDPGILNNISTNVWLNLIFFIVFIAFALSFFGFFEITLPGSIANSVGSKSGAGGVIGIFFMALTLALVSFSCTGPILGSLLAGSLSTNGGAIQLSVGMGAFGLALALPFALFALFPGWLNSLPKSGGWLNSVKIVLGFLEVALAIKFLSNADSVEHWGILKREIFLGIWIITGILLVLFLLGILRFKHDPPPARLGWFRITIAVLFAAFTLYLVPGLTKSKYANLSLVSGFPPALSYSVYGDELVKLFGVEPAVINDYDRALQIAKQQNKPVMIDFTGWACQNCRRMEENVWTDPKVKQLLQEQFVLVSLYVDDRKQLPDNDQFLFSNSDGTTKSIRTIGDRYQTLQTVNFINNSQPLYVVISPGEKLMTYPVGYTPNAKDYAAWLQCGLDAFHQSK